MFRPNATGRSSLPQDAQLATDGQKAATDGQKVATDVQEVATDGQAAATDGQQVATAGQKAATDGQQVATAGQKAATDGQEVAADGQEEFFEEESAELPDSVIIALLKREHLLTIVELNALSHEHSNDERTLSSLQTQLRQVQLPTSASICIYYPLALSVTQGMTSKAHHSNSAPSNKGCSC